MKWLVACVFVVVLSLAWSADDECPLRKSQRSRAEYPDPMNPKDVAKCGRGGQTSHICDPDCIITISQANFLDALIERIENGTRCPCAKHYCSGEDARGYRIGVALLMKMEKDENMVMADTEIDNGRLFAYTLEQRWEWGECSEDIVIFYSLRDNVLYTMTGTETAKKLLPTMVGEVSINSRKSFGNGRSIYKGLASMIMDYRDILMGNYTSGLNRSDPPRTAAVIGRDNGAGTRSVGFLTLILSILTGLFALS